MRTTITLIAVAVATLSVPAAAAAAEAPAKKSSASETKYCIEFEQTTGRHTRDVECRTKAEWARRGVDVANPDRQ